MENTLYFGDNLDILREYVKDETVDLVYLDPPFNSNATYNVLFKAPTGEPAEAQAEAFVDTWHWGPEAAAGYSEVMSTGSEAAGILRALRSFFGENDLMAYLTNMTARIIELHRVMKPTASLYLHCDPTASHYLKIILDGIFGPTQFKNEVIWKRTSAHSSAKRYGPVHDVLLFYAKGPTFTWNKLFQPYDPYYIEQFYTHVDTDGRRWRRSDLTGAGTRNGETGKIWRGIDVTAKGRHWAYPPADLEKLDEEGKIHWPKKANGVPQMKRYLDEQPGTPLQDVWTDLPPLHNLAAERLGYPTQKPLSLLERIIGASSNEGDLILDPFCGCGTTVHAAHSMSRKWIGVDVTHYAVTLIENRLKASFDDIEDLVVSGRPRDMEAARDLAARDKYQFQWWATWLLGAHAYKEGKKGADRGIDGLYFFKNGPMGTGLVVVSVKGGENVGPSMIRDLRGTIEREDANLGVFVTLTKPTPKMVAEASGAGRVKTAHGYFPKIQIVTIDDLLAGKRPDMPPGYVVHNRMEMRKAGGTLKKVEKVSNQLSFTFPIPGGKKAKASASSLWDEYVKEAQADK